MITNGRQTVGTTAVKIASRASVYSRLYIHNDDNTKDLYIGGPDVTSSNGYKIVGLSSEQFDLPPLDDMYMISGSGNHPISWIRIEIR